MMTEMCGGDFDSGKSFLAGNKDEASVFRRATNVKMNQIAATPRNKTIMESTCDLTRTKARG